MDNYFNFSSDEPKANRYLKIVILGYFFSFILSTLIYCLIHFKIILQENDPNIDLSGIKDISFYSIDKRIEYQPGMSNLGETGQLIFDCYTGFCSAWTDIYYEYTKKVPYYECSNRCRIGKKTCSCSNVYLNDGFWGCYYKENDEYTRQKSCYANNLILFWKEKAYQRTRVITNGFYTYNNSSIKANESCPEGTIMCGILDNLGNKLCYPSEYECPVNYITTDIKDDNISDYKVFYINDKKYYYTNKKNETGKILGGLFADSDLLIKYDEEDCEILETDNISSFLKSNNYSLYINSLNFAPNKDSNIYKNGKAYLKWCVPGVGKEKNIDIIKDRTKIYENNITNNNDYLRPIKKKVDKYYFIILPGYILVFLNMVISTLCYCCNKINEKSETDKCNCAATCYRKDSFFCFISIIFCLSWLFLIISLILSIKPLYLLFSALGTQFINHLIIILIILYLIYICLNIFIIIIFCFFFRVLDENRII